MTTTMTDLLEYLAGSRSTLLASLAGLSNENAAPLTSSLGTAQVAAITADRASTEQRAPSRV